MIWTIDLPPFMPFYLAALLSVFLRGWLRAIVMLAVPVLGGLQLTGLEIGEYNIFALMGFEFSPFRVDRLSILFGYLFHIAAFIGILYSLHVRDTVQQVAALLYAGSALGAVFRVTLLPYSFFGKCSR